MMLTTKFIKQTATDECQKLKNNFTHSEMFTKILSRAEPLTATSNYGTNFVFKITCVRVGGNGNDGKYVNLTST